MLKNDRIGCKFITICCMTTYKMKTFLLFWRGIVVLNCLVKLVYTI